ncbi:carboxymuconolactone decarboxylase family protein [Polyangium sp. y55x31]|uniref:carboxymuconolactone decarboxylase family protein n=1 Tax=Polyangium sp. y55x31 TaxID=3042688 RepID=UPI00248260E4|nr:carboxymuconolactone decarboxylase family protein [Polyangium sp. y55x31]MDI1480581.1 carboxymuconolactone decarboxylase family protein [Polyangium sp. y55x31]
MPTTPRTTDYFKRAEAGFKPLYAVEAGIRTSTLEMPLLHLMALRASQINACAYCIQVHVAEALKAGETPLRLHMLPAWRESPLYSERERAALAWTEALTLVAETGAPDADWALVEAAFTEDERAFLTLSIATINLWNRVQIGFRAAHGMTLPEAQTHAA